VSLAGIDLGTSTLIVTACDPAGNPRVLDNDHGDLFTPTVVYFDVGGQVLVGTEASHLGILHPERCIRLWKRSIGTPTVLYRDERGKEYRARDVAKLLLEFAARLFQERTGEILAQAAVAVPANFSDVQKKEVIEAGREAGIEVFLTPHEPTAAAMGNRVHTRGDGLVLLLDLGGGTFDVSLCRVRGNTVEVLGTNGVPQLGGADFTQRLFDRVLDAFENEHGFRPTVVEHPVEVQELHGRVEQAKIALSKRDETTILLAVGGKVLSHRVTLAEFQALTRDLLEQAMACTRATLTECSTSVEELREIIPVGGASKMKVFLDAIEETFGRPASTHADAFFAVGLGAFTLGRLQRETQGQAVEFNGRRLPPLEAYVRDVTAHPIGIAVIDDKQRVRNSVILEKGRPLPSDHAQPFQLAQPGQTACVIQVLQGVDGALAESCTELGRFELRNLKAVHGTPHRIDIRLHIDHNGILTAEAEDKHSSVREELRMTQDLTTRGKAA